MSKISKDCYCDKHPEVCGACFDESITDNGKQAVEMATLKAKVKEIEGLLQECYIILTYLCSGSTGGYNLAQEAYDKLSTYFETKEQDDE